MTNPTPEPLADINPDLTRRAVIDADQLCRAFADWMATLDPQPLTER